MLISAQWKVTLGGVVLLDFGENTEGELQMERSQLVQTVQPIRAAYEVRFPRGNEAHTITFTRVVVCASNSAAQQLMFSSALPTGLVSCTLQPADNTAKTWTLSNACIAPNGYRPQTQGAWFLAQYQIVGGQLS